MADLFNAEYKGMWTGSHEYRDKLQDVFDRWDGDSEGGAQIEDNAIIEVAARAWLDYLNSNLP